MMKIGLFGSEALLRPHVEAYKTLNIGVTAAGESNGGAAPWIASALGCPQAASLEDMITNHSIEVVHIAAEPHAQAAFVAEALQNKLHVVCEMPMAPTALEANRLLRLAADQGVKLLPSRVTRYAPDYAAAKDRLDSGSLGSPAVVRMERVVAKPDDPHAERSVILEEMVKDIDYLIWCFGPVQRVMGKSTKGRVSDAGEHALVTLRLGNGVIAHLEAGWSPHNRESRWALEISCRSGMITHDSRTSQGLTVDGGDVAKPLAGPDSWLLVRNAYARHLEAVVAQLNGAAAWDTQSEPMVLAAVEAVLDSVRSGDMVTVSGEVKA